MTAYYPFNNRCLYSQSGGATYTFNLADGELRVDSSGQTKRIFLKFIQEIEAKKFADAPNVAIFAITVDGRSKLLADNINEWEGKALATDLMNVLAQVHR